MSSLATKDNSLLFSFFSPAKSALCGSREELVARRKTTIVTTISTTKQPQQQQNYSTHTHTRTHTHAHTHTHTHTYSVTNALTHTLFKYPSVCKTTCRKLPDT